MKHDEIVLRDLKHQILDMMNRIEKKHDKMIHHIDSELSEQVFDAFDLNKKFNYHDVIKKLEVYL